MHVDGGFLDLLCVDVQGRATVVEIKRGKLMRETIAQAIDYAASIAAMSVETLKDKVTDYRLGLRRTYPGLSVLLDPESGWITSARWRSSSLASGRILALNGSSISLVSRFIDFQTWAVTFDVFDLPDGQQVIVREEIEPESTPAQNGGAANTEAAVIGTRSAGPRAHSGAAYD